VDKLTSALQERGGAGSPTYGEQVAYWIPRGASQSADIGNLSGSMSSPAVICTVESVAFDFLPQDGGGEVLDQKGGETPGTVHLHSDFSSP
jgi:hypothetical protein